MTRRAAALWSLVWLAAVAVVPALHLVGHRDDHIHVGGAIVWLTPEPAHPRQVAADAEAPPPRPEDPPAPDPTDAPPGHGIHPNQLGLSGLVVGDGPVGFGPVSNVGADRAPAASTRAQPPPVFEHARARGPPRPHPRGSCAPAAHALGDLVVAMGPLVLDER